LLVLGVLPALVFDPQAEGCGQCPANLLLVSDQSGASEELYRAGVYAGLGWALALSLLAVRSEERRVGKEFRSGGWDDA